MEKEEELDMERDWEVSVGISELRGGLWLECVYSCQLEGCCRRIKKDIGKQFRPIHDAT